jgi:uncharacterized protein
MAIGIRRIWAGLKTWPDGPTWRDCVGIFLLYALFAWGIGFATGLYVFDARFDLALLRTALIALIIPALGEEVFFRGLLIPTAAEKANARLRIGIALLAFLLWHPLNAFLFFPHVLPLFSDWRFLLVTACLGLACSHLWRKTGSLWPAIALHWLVVVVWKGFLGAPDTM